MTNNRIVLTLTALCALALGSCSSDDSGDRGNWKQRSVFDGVPRSNVAAFTIGSYGYMGTGYDGDDYLTDFWQYDIENDYWVQKADFPGTARSSAKGFELDGLGYVGTGYDGDFEMIAWTILGVLVLGGYLYFEWYFKKPKN